MGVLLVLAALCVVAAAQIAPNTAPAPDLGFARQEKYILAPKPSQPSPAVGYSSPGASVPADATAALAAAAPAPEFVRAEKYILAPKPSQGNPQAFTPSPGLSTATRETASLAADTAPAPSSGFVREEKYILAPKPSPVVYNSSSGASYATNETASLAASVETSTEFTENSRFPRHANYLLPNQPAKAEMENAITEGAKTEAAPAAVSGFVTTSGQNFILNGKIHFFPGSNDYFLILR